MRTLICQRSGIGSHSESAIAVPGAGTRRRRRDAVVELSLVPLLKLGIPNCPVSRRAPPTSTRPPQASGERFACRWDSRLAVPSSMRFGDEEGRETLPSLARAACALQICRLQAGSTASERILGAMS